MKLVYVLWVFLFAGGMFSGCKKESGGPAEPDPSNTAESATGSYTSTTGGTFSTTSGYSVSVIGGVIPRNSDGQAASVTFSIETAVTPPSAFPAGAALKGPVVRFGPEGFFFQWPVRIRMKYAADIDPSTLTVMYYDAVASRWIALPGSGVDPAQRTISADVLTLGYFALATLSPSAKTSTGSAFGGFVYDNPEPGKWYTLTVRSVSNWVYPWQETWFGSQIVGRTGSTGTSFIGGPDSKTYILIPQASYEIWVSVTDGSGVFYTYTLPLGGRITQEVIYGTQTTGWTPIGGLPSGGSWVQGLPTNWPQPTVTYGTGNFQATLTWVNSSGKITDYDLHLYGPNNMHVFYAARTSPDSSFRLDRDWRSALGHATENIFSLKNTLPAGAYRVAVMHYAGSANSYSVRILRSGNVRTYSGSTTASGETEVASFTLP